MRRDTNRSRSATPGQETGSGAVPDQRGSSQPTQYDQAQGRSGTTAQYPTTQEGYPASQGGYQTTQGGSRQATQERYPATREGRRGETEAYDDSYGRRDVGVPRRHYFGMAGVLSVLSGLLTFFLGIIGLIHRGLIYSRVANYPFYYSTRSRGITFIILGAVAVAVGLALLAHLPFSRHIGTLVAVLTAIAMFMFLPFSPFWSVVLLALNILIIWELTRERRREFVRLSAGQARQRLCAVN